MSDTYTLYNSTVMDHFMNPRNMGDLRDADGVGEVGAAACGDIMKISLKIKDGKIEDARFKTFGCGSGVATPNIAPGIIERRTDTAGGRRSPAKAWRRNGSTAAPSTRR